MLKSVSRANLYISEAEAKESQQRVLDMLIDDDLHGLETLIDRFIFGGIEANIREHAIKLLQRFWGRSFHTIIRVAILKLVNKKQPLLPTAEQHSIDLYEVLLPVTEKSAHVPKLPTEKYDVVPGAPFFLLLYFLFNQSINQSINQ